MLFRRCTIAGVDYNHPPNELENQLSKPGSPAPPLQVNTQLVEDMNNLIDKGIKFSIHAQRIHEFLLVLAICNTVVVSQIPHR